MTTHTQRTGAKKIFALIKQALAGGEQDYTQGSIRRAVILLAIPMMLEMMGESVFAVVDIFFVGRINKQAPTAVGLTESVLTIVYSVAIGLSMAATALVARRVGEKNTDAASRAAAQCISFAIFITIFISIAGVIFAPDILHLMGALPDVVSKGAIFTRVIFGGSIFIMLLFLINGIFRGAGDASLAMQSLLIANIFNIALCPTLINGWGPFPKLGIEGAAIATTTGRCIGVMYQLSRLMLKKGKLRMHIRNFLPDWKLLKSIVKISWTGTFQFLVGSLSWMFLAMILAGFKNTELFDGYQVAMRLIMFFILPAWGLSNAVATLVGQNLGAKQPDRAEKSVWIVTRYVIVFMVLVSLYFQFAAQPLIAFMNPYPEIQAYTRQALQVISLGYIFYGVAMVMMNVFNGAGDTKTPTLVNIGCFWFFQIPLAYLLTHYLHGGPSSVFFCILVTEALVCIVNIIIFRRGKWKKVIV
ncbi:MAG TPA: MATE family efflux transporter [Chitinophagaceae bacterium]|nr:MATE family efflux transporter [Chitinophagaceae bacterium]